MQIGNAVARGQFLLKVPRRRRGRALQKAQRPLSRTRRRSDSRGIERAPLPVTAPAVGASGVEAGAAGGAWTFWEGPKQA